MAVINRLQILFKNLLTVKDWTFDIAKIKSYLMFAFPDMLSYTSDNVIE